MSELTELQQVIEGSSHIVFFGGAGVSTESGIPDFRSVDGLYHQQYRFPPETIISHDFFEERPEEFFDFYREKMLCLTAKPNPAHFKLAELERQGKLDAVVTQNIDGLHQLAGSKNVLELHGSVHRNTCRHCGKHYDAAFILQSTGVPRCSCGGLVKPDVVLYGEQLDESVLSHATSAIAGADTLIIGGTSLAVYPAAGLIDLFHGRHLVLINRTPTHCDDHADLVCRQSIGELLGQIQIIQ